MTAYAIQSQAAVEYHREVCRRVELLRKDIQIPRAITMIGDSIMVDCELLTIDEFRLVRTVLFRDCDVSVRKPS